MKTLPGFRGKGPKIKRYPGKEARDHSNRPCPQPAEEWIASTSWADLWPSGEKLAGAVERIEAEAGASGTILDGDVERAVLSRLWTESDWPSDLAKAGRWEDARRLWEHWTEAATAAGHLPRDLSDDVEDMADAVESLWPSTMSDLSNFDHTARRETLAEGPAEDEAKATLSEGLRWIKEDRPAGVVDLGWPPIEVTWKLVRLRVEALEAWGPSPRVRRNPEGSFRVLGAVSPSSVREESR